MMALRSQRSAAEAAGGRLRLDGGSPGISAHSQAMTVASPRPSAVPIHLAIRADYYRLEHEPDNVADTVLSASAVPVRQSCSGGWPVMRKCCQSCEDKDR